MDKGQIQRMVLCRTDNISLNAVTIVNISKFIIKSHECIYNKLSVKHVLIIVADPLNVNNIIWNALSLSEQ